MATASPRLIQHQSKFIKRVMGPGSGFARKLEAFLQVAASGSGISIADLESTLGCSEVEVEEYLDANLVFVVDDYGLITLTTFGFAFVGGCLGVPWSAPPNGLFTEDEEANWEELFLKMDKVKSGIAGLSVNQMFWEYFLLNLKLSMPAGLPTPEGKRVLAMDGLLGHAFQYERDFLAKLTMRSSDLEPYSVVAKIAQTLCFDTGPCLHSFELEGEALTAQAAKETLDAFDCLLQHSPYVLAVLVCIGEKPSSTAVLATELGCSRDDVEAAVELLGGHIEGTSKKYSLSSSGEHLFTKHFLRRSNYSKLAPAFASSSPEKRDWFRAEQLMLNAEVGPAGERLKELATEPYEYGKERYLADGVTSVEEFLESLGLSHLWHTKRTFEITNIPVLVGKIPALKPYKKGLSFAKKHKTSLPHL